MQNKCPTTPYEKNSTPYSGRVYPFIKKESLYNKKQNPYSKNDNVYSPDHFCGILLQENKYPILLESGIMIKI